MTWYHVAGLVGAQKCLILQTIQDFLNNSMKSQKFKLNTSWEKLGEVDIRRGIFQGNYLSPLLFVLCMVPLTWLLRRAKAAQKWGNMEFKLNNLLLMVDLKLFAKSKNQISVEYLLWREEKLLEQMLLECHMGKT